MSYTERKSEDFLKEQRLRQTQFEREAAFAYRWALKSGRTQEIYFSQETLRQAFEFLGNDDVEVFEGENLSIVSAVAVEKYFRHCGMEGANVEPMAVDIEKGNSDFVVVSVKPKV